MKKAGRFSITLLALCGLFLAGCGSTEVSSSASDPESSSSELSTVDSSSEDSSSVSSGPVLTQEHIEAISGDNITFSGTALAGTLQYGFTEYETTVRYADGYWQGDNFYVIEDGSTEYVYSDVYTFLRTDDGYVASAHAPNINNEVTSAYTTLWNESIFINMFYAFDASWFEYDSTYSDDEGRNKFVMTADALASEDVYYAALNLFSSLAEYTFGTSYGGELKNFYFFTDADNENIVSFNFYEVDGSYSAYGITFATNISFDVSNIGSTVIDDSYLYSPYSIPEGQESQYAAFESALVHLEEHNYTAYAECVDTTDPNHIYQESKYQVTENGFSGVDYTYEYDEETDERSLVSTGYFGTYEAEEGRWDYYEGTSLSSLAGLENAGSNPWYNFPDHDLAVEIFDLDTEASTEDIYVFKLKKDMLDRLYAYLVAGEFTGDYFRDYIDDEADFTVSISKDGYINSFSFVYDDYSHVSTFTQTFSGWGTTEITSDVADFTDYTMYEFPNFDNTYVTNWDDESFPYITLREALVILYGEEIGNQIPDFMAGDRDISDRYFYGTFLPETSGLLQISFDYYWTNYDFNELLDGFDAITKAFIDAGATLTLVDGYYEYTGTMCDGAVEISVFINSDYYVSVNYSIPSFEA